MERWVLSLRQAVDSEFFLEVNLKTEARRLLFTEVVGGESVARILLLVLSYVVIHRLSVVTPNVFAWATLVTPAFIPVIAENTEKSHLLAG